jgi:hypothetical protein
MPALILAVMFVTGAGISTIDQLAGGAQATKKATAARK